MARLTRVEQRAQTRIDLLAAARDRFLEVGYASASLEEIAESAGYSKGAVYSNFVDKPSLCREVLQGIHDEKVGELSTIVTGPGTLAERIYQLTEWVERTSGDNNWTLLEIEFITVARTDDTLRAMIVDLRTTAHSTIVDMLRDMLRDRRSVGDPPRDETDATAVELELDLYELESTADLLLAGSIGVALQRAVDPTLSIEPVIASFRSTLTLLGAGVY